MDGANQNHVSSLVWKTINHEWELGVETFSTDDAERRDVKRELGVLFQ